MNLLGNDPSYKVPRPERPRMFAICDLSVLAYAHGFTHWHYKAGAARLDDVMAADFFNGSGDMIATGDMILVSAADGGGMLYVVSAGDGVVVQMMTAAVVGRPLAVAAE